MQNSDLQTRIAAYFAALEAPLLEVPASQRREFVDEARSHLSAMVEARRADGLDENAAWDAALGEFGEPEQIGRALHRQWANSGQLESEGAPLSKKRIYWLIALPVVGCVVAYAFASLLLAPTGNAGWQIAVIALVMFGSIGVGIASDVRKRGGWKPSTIVGCVYACLISAKVIADFYGGFQTGGNGRYWGEFALKCGFLSLYFWLYKRERADRPWRFSARFKTNPIAAEQEYRLGPLVGLAMGTVMGCIGLVAVGLQFFGLPLALFSCAGLIGGAVVCGWWLRK